MTDLTNLKHAVSSLNNIESLFCHTILSNLACLVSILDILAMAAMLYSLKQIKCIESS